MEQDVRRDVKQEKKKTGERRASPTWTKLKQCEYARPFQPHPATKTKVKLSSLAVEMER